MEEWSGAGHTLKDGANRVFCSLAEAIEELEFVFTNRDETLGSRSGGVTIRVLIMCDRPVRNPRGDAQ